MTPDVRPLKNRLREESKQIRRNFSFEEKKKKDAAIFWRLTGLPQYQHCRMLLTFVSTPIEVDTRRIIQQALRDQKQVVVPRCIPDQIQMEFCRIHSLRDLKKGTFSVMEPKTYCKVIRCFRNSICIVVCKISQITFKNMSHSRRHNYRLGWLIDKKCLKYLTQP